MAKPLVVVDGAVRNAPYQHICVDGVWRRARYGFGVVDGALRQEWSAADLITQPDFDRTISNDVPWGEDWHYARYPFVDITDYAWLTASYIMDHTGRHPAPYPPGLTLSVLLVNIHGGHEGTNLYVVSGLHGTGWTDRGDAVIDLRHLTGNHQMAFNMHTKNQAVFDVESTCRLRVSNIQFIPE